MESVTFKVEGIEDETDKVNVINALHKYSGVLDIGVDMHTKLVRVEYDPSNIRAEDMQQDIEKEKYHVVYVVRN
ncbi:heavy-metal-associated domain-containing protein [Desulfoscipio sp. XC116]|uniref:heavy-metal-associated domain-containing protein n=1 Tax=Desulfoscipio sp. XC116 TaxID=3144975 RepID=UPI00325BC40C